MNVQPYKPGMRIKSGESVFVFVDGVTVETFEKDEDFRSGTVSAVVAGKVRIEWDDLVKAVRGGRTELVRSYAYVPCDRLTRVSRETWVLDYKSAESVSPVVPAMPDVTEMSDAPAVVTEMSDSPEMSGGPAVVTEKSDSPETTVKVVKPRTPRSPAKTN